MPEAAERSFPRRQAATRRFTLGTPRNVTVSSDGTHVVFLRSAAGDDPVNAVWVFDVESGIERLLFDPAEADNRVGLPAAEMARRERARESGQGIVGYSTDASGRHIAFVAAGAITIVDVETGDATTLDSADDAFDPVISPDGTRVAYVSGAALRVASADGDSMLVSEPGDTISWGSAEFIAGEEMGRTRGLWWAPDGDRLLVERVDVAPVGVWWIAAPVSPDESPTPIRYPAAGTANAQVDLAIVDLNGDRTDVIWNDGSWEYLSDASWTVDGLILTVQSRDQRCLAVLDIDPDNPSAIERYRVDDADWVELVPGSPRLHGARLVTIEDRGSARRVCVDGEPITGADLQIRRLVATDDSGLIVMASSEPTSVGVARVSWTGEVEWITPAGGVATAAAGGDTLVISRRSLDHDGAITTVSRDRFSKKWILDDKSETPNVKLNVSLHRLGPRRLDSALLLPHDAGPDDLLPVLLDPYGGPHAQRVLQLRSAFHTSQWFADQGFAVLVTDGRGTPGRGPLFEREVRGDLAAPVLEDQIDALMAAARLDTRLDLTRVAIRGWSFGGYLAALAMLRRPDIFHAAIAGAPVTDWRLYDTHYTERYLGDPREEPENYIANDLSTDVTAPSQEFPERPLMLIHGLADDNVVAAHTLRLSRELLGKGRAHTVLPLSGVTHMTPQEEVAENLLLLQLGFLRDALG